MPFEHVRGAYDARAQEYIAVVGSIEAAKEADRALIGSWGSEVRGRVLDVGCGPGQWTDYLHRAGAEVAGVDPAPEFIVHARRRYSGLDFRTGRAEDLGVRDASLGGVLAWYSLIHTEPELMGRVFTEFARSIRAEGTLLVGFFEGPDLVRFDHAVASAYLWPMAALVRVVEDAGFVVTEVHTRTDPGSRPHGALIARRVPR